MTPRPRKIIAGLLAPLMAACSLTVDEAELGGERDLDDVNHCGKCGQPCPPVTNAELACGSSSCYIRLCDVGFKDCNQDSSDGCEVDATTDPHHCGACERLCAGDCTAGKCQPS